jgi:oxygen-independent coproporphyrinogen-3 oxidase
LAQGEFPIVRGLALTRDDLLRRTVIMALMCQGRVEFESIELAHLIKVRETFATEFGLLQPLVEMGMVEISDEAIQVTATGWFFVRAVAMVFDKHLRADKVRERFSRII